MKRKRAGRLPAFVWRSMIIAIGSLLAFTQAALTQIIPGTSPEVDLACQELLEVKVFAFGGVGFAGTISEGENAFRTVAADTDAVQLFKTVLTNGTPAGRLNALCGIRRLAPKDFRSLAKNV